ncbi:MAG: DUF362 domain-containing protein [Geobacteraceae bacterium]|nr:DUF362 domain-containing protein [Geobacteraceae bacterium]
MGVNSLYDIYFYKKNIKYPSPEGFFNPQSIYPEYPWPGDNCTAKNDVYDAVRETLFGIGLDSSNYGTTEWNPLGDIITSGNTVLVKPNWVSHKNNNPKAGLDCLVTHTSIVRAVLDYCIIALKGSGKIILGDAPIQGGDLEILFSANHVNEMLKFYRNKGVAIEICDFRMFQTYGKNGVWHKRTKINNDEESIAVDLGINSEFHKIENTQRKYHVMDYNATETEQYHCSGKHIYSINKHVLDADVIINLPKPKSHKLAGVTGALKNMVGIVADKACLPHDSLGSKSAGGDSYPNRNLLKAASIAIRELKTKYEEKSYYTPALITRYIDSGLRLLMRMTSNNHYEFGSWYGNDTIWRTILDLNTIVQFANKKGIIQKTVQRKQFHVADMIISGENEGPLSPSPKEIGVIVAGFNAALVDSLIARIMGFDEKKIPTINYALERICDNRKNKAIELKSNDSIYCRKSLDDIEFPKTMRFKPHSGWKGYIER